MHDILGAGGVAELRSEDDGGAQGQSLGVLNVELQRRIDERRGAIVVAPLRLLRRSTQNLADLCLTPPGFLYPLSFGVFDGAFALRLDTLPFGLNPLPFCLLSRTLFCFRNPL